MITDAEIKATGFRALVAALGDVQAEKFIALIQRETRKGPEKVPGTVSSAVETVTCRHTRPPQQAGRFSQVTPTGAGQTRDCSGNREVAIRTGAFFGATMGNYASFDAASAPLVHRWPRLAESVRCKNCCIGYGGRGEL